MKKYGILSFWVLLTVVSMTIVVFSSCNKEDDESNNLATTLDRGVLINGVIWATRNVDAPGTFVANPEDAGMLYLWNIRIGLEWFNATDFWGNYWWEWEEDEVPVVNATEWERSNDPSPAGWRVPTIEELKTLFDTDKVISDWTAKNGVFGRKFIDRASGNSMFLPAQAYWSSSRVPIDEYWGNSLWWDLHAYNLRFCSTFETWSAGGLFTHVSNVRSVAR